MKLSTFFLLTHGVATATVAAFTAALYQTADPPKVSLVAALTAVAGGVAAWRATRSIRSSLMLVELVAADHEKSETEHTGLAEFDRILQSLGKCAVRWETAAATNRRQKRELQSMMRLLGGGANREPTSWHLRDLLADLGGSLHLHHHHIERAAAEIQRHCETVAEAHDSQRHSLTKAASCTQQLLAAIDAANQTAASVTATGRRSGALATSALTQLGAVIESLGNAQTDVQHQAKISENSDGPGRQSGGLSVWIAEIAERAHLLVLNASLQSIHTSDRATGALGIADECRALVLDLRAAAQGVASLLGTTDRVPAEIIDDPIQHHEQVAEEIARANSVAQSLTHLCHALEEQVLCLRHMSEATAHQRQLACELQTLLDQCCCATQTQHESAARVRHELRTLTKDASLIDRQIERMRSCGSASARAATTSASDTLAIAPADFSATHPELATAGAGDAP